MTKYVAFLRAINVPGHASVRMSDAKEAFAAAGGKNVRTYIQSGNVLFEALEPDADWILKQIRSELQKLIGNEATVVLRKLHDIERMVQENPFKDVDKALDAKLYVAFLASKPTTVPELPLHEPKECLQAIGLENLEVFIVSRRKENGFYGFPNNFIEKELGVLATSRNWNTVCKIAKLAQG